MALKEGIECVDIALFQCGDKLGHGCQLPTGYGLKTVKQTGNVILVCRNEHCHPMKTERHVTVLKDLLVLEVPFN